MQITAIVDASRRFEHLEGCVYTRMLKYTTVIKKLLDTLRKNGVTRIVVITGYEKEELERHIAHRGTVCIYRDNWENDDPSAWLLGLKEAEDSERVLVIPGNMPLLTEKELETMIQAEEELSVYGTPGERRIYSISGELAEQILEDETEPDDTWAKEHRVQVGELDLADDDHLFAICSEGDLQRALELEANAMDENDLTWTTKLMISRGEGFFGPGVARFFTMIDETGSMSAACKSMEMSYSRGWTLVKNVEDRMGFPFLERKFGGKGKGYSKLTDRGREFLQAYYNMDADIRRMSQALFALHFGEILRERPAEGEE